MTGRRVHLITPNLVPGDAVSHDALGMRDWFRQRGWQAQLYVRYQDAAYRHQAQPFGNYERFLDARDDLLIYHHSTGWPTGQRLFERSRNHRLLRYHNVTPARFFRGYHPEYALGCTLGALETRALVQTGPAGFLADSEYNADGLVRAGAERSRCHVVPPLHTIGSLDSVPEDPRLADELRGRTNILFVGRIAPNKGHLHLIRALACYYRHGGAHARLHLVGDIDHRLESYMDELVHEIACRGLQDAVVFPGKVTRRQLKTYYTHASLFLCASEHEGFCVPVVEAMYYRVPTVAYATSGVRHTLGADGLCWDSPDPELLAESMHAVLSQPELRQHVVQVQSERFERCFSHAVLEQRLGEALTPLLEAPTSDG
jgi:glycosyltransferase involved in cell wall biosynthesis